MTTILRQTETELGTVKFVMNNGKFEIRTPKLTFTVYEDDIKEQDGKHYFTIPDSMVSCFDRTNIIEIPADVLKRWAESREDAEKMKVSLCKVETSHGKVYISIGEEDQIILKYSDKTIETKNIYSVEGKRVICVSELGILELPPVVEYEIGRIKHKREENAKGLVYAGKSLLTGRDFFKFNYELSRDTFNRVKDLMVYFEPGEEGTLSGWLTTQPEKIEERLRIRNNLVSDRKEEIEKQKEQAAKDNKKLTEKLMKGC